MSKYILAHDLGTSGNKAAIFRTDGTLVGSTLFEYPTYYPKDGWVEQNPQDWWRAVCQSTKELLEKTKVKASEIGGISFSAHMMGCLLVDKEGTPLRKMLIWADTRSKKQEEFMIQQIGLAEGYKRTGHRLSASYSAAKLLWIKDNEPELYKQGYKMLHVKDYVIYRLTGNFVTDYSDASGTNLLNLTKKEWDEDILSALKIEKSLLPDILPSSAICGYLLKDAAAALGLISGIPIITGGGDGSCACVGAGVVDEGKAYNILGSSSWISAATKAPIFDKEMRTFTWLHLDENLYTPCGTMQAAGYSYSWYKELFCQEEKQKAAEKGINVYEYLNEEILTSPVGANGLLYLPYLLGERSPRWNHNARGAFIGMSPQTGKADVSRAVLEGVSLNLKIILDIIQQDIIQQAINIDEIIVIGGGAKGRVWVQMLADIYQKKILLPQYLEEATTIGAAVCGGIGMGAFDNFTAVEKFNKIVDIVLPNPTHRETYEKLAKAFESSYRGLCEAYEILVRM